MQAALAASDDRARRVPIAKLLVALLVVGGIGAGTYAIVSSSPDAPSRTYAKRLPPPTAAAYQEGGVPLRDAAIEKLLADELTALIVETGRARESATDSPSRKERTQRLAAAPAFAAHGPALHAAWREMLDAVDRWVREPITGDSFEAVARTLRAKIRAVSDQMVARGLGYYLESDVDDASGGQNPVMYAYRVEEVVFVIAGDRPRRVLALRRLDRLAVPNTLLGMLSPEIGDPVLLLDSIEKHVATRLLPVLAPGARLELVDQEYLATPEGAAVANAAGAAIRAELVAVLGADARAAQRIAVLLVERHRILAASRDELARQGTDQLFVPAAVLERLEGKERSRVEEIDDDIARLEGSRIAARCHDLVAATTRRHEAQHGVDADRDVMLRYPHALARLAGPAEIEGAPLPGVERARHELSAYTSQLANDPVTPQLSLWNAAQFAFTERLWGTPESYMALVLVEGLAQHLGIAADGPVVHGGSMDRARLAALGTKLAAVPGPQLREAARKTWLELFDEPFVPIVDRR